MHSKGIALLILAGGVCLSVCGCYARLHLVPVGFRIFMGENHIETMWIRIYDADFIFYFMGIALLFFLNTAEMRNRIFGQVI